MIRRAVFRLLAGLLLFHPARALAHEGPPYAILVDRVIGPCQVSVWADPDVGVGTFFIIPEPVAGGTIPDDLIVEVGVRPASGRLAEVRHPARRESIGGRIQYQAEIPFDAQERWLTHILLRSSQGGGEANVEVEVTPPGYGRWDLLIYLLPFLAIGALWLKAFLRGRARNQGA
jgi:hypothetical protein